MEAADVGATDDIEDYGEGETAGSKFEKVRQAAAAGQELAARAMTRRGKQLLKEFQVGDNATLKVPEFDRGPSDARNLLVVVMSKSKDLYKVGCKEGSLRARYTTADLDPINKNLLSVTDVPNVELPLRTAITKYTGGQGYANEGLFYNSMFV